VSAATAIPRFTEDARLAKRRRITMTKAAIALLFVLALMSIGFRGRQHARLQARLKEISRVGLLIQRKLDDEQTPAEQLVGAARGTTNYASPPASSNNQVEAGVNNLKLGIGRFESDYRPRLFSEVESLDLRLAKATLANAERRFADALMIITDADERAKSVNPQTEKIRLARVEQVRGDSYYGLHQWRDALDHYEQMLILQPDRVVALARAAECQYALGKANEAVKWQEKALGLAPTNKQIELRARLELYKSGKP